MLWVTPPRIASPSITTGARSQWPTQATASAPVSETFGLARLDAVADRPGADAHDVHRLLEERVERDDLVHLAAADVHPVGERVGELGRDRPDLAADPAEVVEQVRPLEGSSGRSGVRARTSVVRLSLPMERIESIRELPHTPRACLRLPLRPAQPLAARGFVHRRERRRGRRRPHPHPRAPGDHARGSDRGGRGRSPVPPCRPRLARDDVGEVAWEIRSAGGGSLVSLSAEVERASTADRLLLALGGRAWLRRRFASVLETLDRRLG